MALELANVLKENLNPYTVDPPSVVRIPMPSYGCTVLKTKVWQKKSPMILAIWGGSRSMSLKNNLSVHYSFDGKSSNFKSEDEVVLSENGLIEIHPWTQDEKFTDSHVYVTIYSIHPFTLHAAVGFGHACISRLRDLSKQDNI